MRSILYAALLCCLGNLAQGQNTGTLLAQQAGQGVKAGAEAATEKTGENLGNKLLNSLFTKKNKKKETAATGRQSDVSGQTVQNPSTGSNPNIPAAPGGTGSGEDGSTGPFRTYSKFDFVPGSKVVAYDDFSGDAIGDFPATWNTNSAGEVVNVSSGEGHWLMLNKVGKFIPEYIQSLPDNFTLEYDVVTNSGYNDYSPSLSLYCLTGAGGKDLMDNWFMADGKRSGIRLDIHPTAGIGRSALEGVETFDQAQSVIKNQVNVAGFTANPGAGLRAHIAIWRQHQRLRVYLNAAKVFDLPRAFATGQPYTCLMFQISSDMKNQDQFLVGNLKLAVGDPDTRNQLITEGKFVTRGILFDVNSDQIKPESYGTLKDIAGVLAGNPTVTVRIVGHTDADGNAADNLALSRKRAASVKNTLVTEFGIDATRLQTDGKGAAEPVDTNSTPEGKANNRRVEFIKLQ